MSEWTAQIYGLRHTSGSPITNGSTVCNVGYWKLTSSNVLTLVTENLTRTLSESLATGRDDG